MLAALFLATAPLHIYYSQEARMYAMETFLTVLVVWYLVNIIDSKSKLYFLGLVASSVLLIYSDYLPLFFIDSVFVYLLIYERRLVRRWVSWILISALFYLPWL